MTTTIQIDDTIKKKLFQIKLKIEQEKGSSITYNEIIDYLIKNQATNILRKKNLEKIREFKGILPKGTLSELLEERERELIQEEKKAPLQKSSYDKELRKKIYNQDDNQDDNQEDSNISSKQ
ncbi:MAG: hypothetical protein ACOCT9_01895 [archaeon]